MALSDRLNLPSPTVICQATIRRAAVENKRGVRTMILLVAWELWKERNGTAFRAKLPDSSNAVEAIRYNMEQWRLVGAKNIKTPFWERTTR